MIEVRELTDADAKCLITKRIMHALPEWFSPPEDIEKKADTHRNYPFFVAVNNSEPVGFLCLKIHNKDTADIFNLGVLKDYHRQGVGSQLVSLAEDFLRHRGFRFLTVKTLDSSAEYEPYERTRNFYKKMGFTALEVFTTFWNEENPCLFLAKDLRPNVQMIGTAYLPVDSDLQKILISKRSPQKVHFPGKWEVLGGNLEPGESFEECVSREVKEEIDCSISDYEHLNSRVMDLGGSLYITATFVGEIKGTPKANESEIAELKWIREEEVDLFDFCPGDAEILKLGFAKVAAKRLH